MITNLTRQVQLARKPVYPTAWFLRMRGMIMRDFSDFDAMVLNNCNAIHTMFMRINIDVLFVDIDNRICDFRKKLVPWVPAVWSKYAVCVVELPAGTIDKTGTQIGDTIDLNAELTFEAENKRKDILQHAGAAIPMRPDVNT